MENKLKEVLKIIFDFDYDGLLNEYLNTNLLATEIDFIDYIATNLNSHLEKLSPQIDFFFNEKINSDTEYENFIMRDEYWFYREYQNYLIEKRTKLVKALPPQPIVESPFSVLEWATIFYYADETKLLPENRIISERMKEFMSKHQINTTFDNFKAKYYEAKKRINEKNDYPINKLELIIPFLKENYKQTVTKVENDIIILEENKPEY